LTTEIKGDELYLAELDAKKFLDYAARFPHYVQEMAARVLVENRE